MSWAKQKSPDFAHSSKHIEDYSPKANTMSLLTVKQTPTFCTNGVCLLRTEVQDSLQLDFAYPKSKVQPFLPLEITTTEKQTPTFFTIGVCLLRTKVHDSLQLDFAYPKSK